MSLFTISHSLSLSSLPLALTSSPGTLLNMLFQTTFDIMQESRRQQTTKGEWLPPHSLFLTHQFLLFFFLPQDSGFQWASPKTPSSWMLKALMGGSAARTRSPSSPPHLSLFQATISKMSFYFCFRCDSALLCHPAFVACPCLSPGHLHPPHGHLGFWIWIWICVLNSRTSGL